MSDRPTREITLMQHAFVEAERSTCSRAHVGVVFALAGRILVTGYNGAPAGMPHCDHTCDCGYPGTGGMLFEGKHLSNCATLSPCLVSVHAEANAIAFAARHGVCLEGSQLFATFSPCVPCAQLLVNVGITKLYAAAMYRITDGIDLLRSAGIEVVDWGNSLMIPS